MFKKDFFALPKKPISINDCEVFHFRSVSEVRFNRPGKDDRFEITKINAWYIKYKMAIIENSYLQSLIPSFQKSNQTEHIYASTAIGKEIKTFIKDDEQTKILQKEFKMELLT